MKIVAVNGGPRKNCNTAQLLDSFLNGVREAAPDAEIEVIHLYDYLYTGCKSCFACQLTANRKDLGCRVKDSIPTNSIVCIGTVGGSPRRLIDRKRFEEGLEELVRVLQPHTILVYGSASYPCFDKLIDQGIKIISYPSRTASAFNKRRQTR